MNFLTIERKVLSAKMVSKFQIKSKVKAWSDEKAQHTYSM